jgi:urea transporter
LTGLGISVFSFGSNNNIILEPQLIAPIILISILSVFVVAAIGNLFINKLGISPFTIPFIICLWIWLLGASSSFAYFPVNGNILQQQLNINPTV